MKDTLNKYKTKSFYSFIIFCCFGLFSISQVTICIYGLYANEILSYNHNRLYHSNYKLHASVPTRDGIRSTPWFLFWSYFLVENSPLHHPKERAIFSTRQKNSPVSCGNVSSKERGGVSLHSVSTGGFL